MDYSRVIYLLTWWFSIAMLNYKRVCPVLDLLKVSQITHIPTNFPGSGWFTHAKNAQQKIPTQKVLAKTRNNSKCHSHRVIFQLFPTYGGCYQSSSRTSYHGNSSLSYPSLWLPPRIPSCWHWAWCFFLVLLTGYQWFYEKTWESYPLSSH